jgi:mitogen-activated protein kinase 15
MLESVPPLKRKTLAEVFPTASAEAIDLISRTLQFNPDKRLTGSVSRHSRCALVCAALSVRRAWGRGWGGRRGS